MLQSKLFLCSDSASIDSRTHTLSVFHIAEGSNAAAFPIALPRITVIAILTREEDDPADVQLQLTATLAGQHLFAGPFPANFAAGLLSRTVVEMQGLVIPGPGDLSFVLRNGEQPLATWIIKVSQVGQPQLQLLLPQVPPNPA
jgi:hypothetical protein